jgi:DnaK suppressor protein
MMRKTVMDDNRRWELAQLREELAQQLRQQRETLFKDVAEEVTELRSMESKRASELEERAQAARDTRLFASLDDHRKEQIEEIDAALERIALGTYGICERCAQPIPLARLRALPTARVHVQCAAEEEQEIVDRPATS